MATEVRLKLVKPHAAQQVILDVDARYKVLDCGRRFGKTELFINAALNGHSPFTSGMLQGWPVAYVGLTEKNVKEFWGRMKQTVPPGLIIKKNDKDLSMTILGGGGIECWTFLNFPAGRGRAYAGMVIDEAAHSHNLKEAWEDVFRATLLDFKGWCLFGSTPHGYNYFYELFQRGDDLAFPKWFSFKYTSYDNPHLDPLEIDEIKRELPPGTFEREYLAEFAVAEGSIFGDFEGCLRDTTQEKPDDTHRYVGGIDWGQTEDYTVLSIVDATAGEEVYLERWRDTSPETVLGHIVEACQQWNAEKLRPELNSMGWNYVQQLNALIARTEGTDISVGGFTTTNDSKRQMIDNLASAMRNNRVKLLKVDYATDELRTFVQTQTANGAYKYDHISGAKSDTVIARMAAWDAACNLIW